MLISQFLAERGLTYEELAEQLADKGYVSARRGAPITAPGIKNMITRGRQVPKGWIDALDGVTAPTSPPGSVDGDGEGDAARSERPPSRPAGAKVTPMEISSGSKKRISGAYKFVGAALASGSGVNGVAIVFGDQADPIADLWIQAANESPWAARFVNAMNAGGVTGDLAAAHLYLAGACLYVLGAGIPGGDALFPKYQQHRVAPKPPADDQAAARPEENGHAAGQPVDAAAGAVVDG